MNEIRFRFMGRRMWILIGILGDDRTMIGVIYYRIISDSSKNRERRYEEKKMLDLWI